MSGHIESGQISDGDGICCKYDFIAGTDWAIVDVIIKFKLNRVTEVECHSMLINHSKRTEGLFGTILLN